MTDTTERCEACSKILPKQGSARYPSWDDVTYCASCYANAAQRQPEPDTTELIPFEPDYHVHPGGTLLESIGWHMMPVFAALSGIPEGPLREICQGSFGITQDIAEKVAAVIGTPADFWMNMQRQYDEWEAKHDGDDWASRPT